MPETAGDLPFMCPVMRGGGLVVTGFHKVSSSDAKEGHVIKNGTVWYDI
jgi:hypothetical protein